MTAKKLTRDERAIIAEHEAGMHDRKAKATCAECQKAPEPVVEPVYTAPEPIITLPVKKARTVKNRSPRKRIAVPQKPSVPRRAEHPQNVEHANREAWMMAAVQALAADDFAAQDIAVPPVRISFGWPGGRGSKRNVRGQCWSAFTVADGIPAIFISPDQSNVVTILGIIAHEMVHAVGNYGHRGPFAKVAKALGFTGPFTSSENKTPELVERLERLASELGPLPHAAVNAAGGLSGAGLADLLAGAGIPLPPPVQTTRMLLLTCSVDGYIVRTTRKWIEVGLPSCPDGHEMKEV